MYSKSYAEFLNNEYKTFAIYDNVINIPNFYDGLKVSQRKVIYTALKYNHMKVAQLASFTSGYTDYKHGEMNLNSVIVGLARDYKCSNNYNYLIPDGSFGTSLIPEPASPRYIYTSLHDNFKMLFNKEDFDLCEYAKDDDDNDIEPTFFIPLLPTLFANMNSGIGNGFSSNIYPRNINHMIDYITECVKKGKSDKKIDIFFNKYTGKAEIDDYGKVLISGNYNVVRRSINITEVPFVTLEKYKALLDKLVDKKIIQDYINNSADDTIDITCKLCPDVELNHDQIVKHFKLEFRDVENITVWKDGYIVKYDNIYNYINDFIPLRLKYYEHRIAHKINKLNCELKKLQDRLTFLQFVISDINYFTKLSKDQLTSEIIKMQISDINDVINIPIYKITQENIDSLKSDIELIENDIKKLENTNIKDLYLSELNQLSKQIKKISAI